MSDQRVVTDHINKILPLLKREPTETVPYPHLTVGWGTHGAYGSTLFGWDAHHEALRLAAGGEPEWLRYQTDLFLSFQDSQTGFIPQMAWVQDEKLVFGTDIYCPYLIQGALIYAAKTGDTEWAEAILPKLRHYLAYYEENQRDDNGLFFWRYCWSGGIDNDAAIAFFPNASICAPNLNALLYLEYRSLQKLCTMLSRKEDAQVYAAKAQHLCDLTNELLWSPESQCYAPFNRKTRKAQISLGEDSDVGRYAFLSHTCLMPLYASMASPERASAVIEKYIASNDHFFSEWGIRSLSRSSEYYNNAVWGNPPRFDEYDRLTNSNWQGPVWVPVNYFIFRALLTYGHQSLARQVMNNLHRTLAADIRENGMMRENYCAETGRPLYAEYFGSWNVLADLMPAEIETGSSIMDYVMEDHNGSAKT